MVRDDRLRQLVETWLGALALESEWSREINPPAHRFDIVPSGAILLIHDGAIEDHNERALLEALAAATDHLTTGKRTVLAGNLSLKAE